MLLILSLLILASCEESACIEAYQFDDNLLKIESFPQEDGIIGSYDHQSGGQIAYWHDTGLRSNGEPFYITIGGELTPWFGNSVTKSSVSDLPICKFCAKHPDYPNDCLCYKNTEMNPDPELHEAECKNIDGVSVMDYKVQHLPLALRKINGTRFEDIDKEVQCKYVQGMNAYIGLFGPSGQESPSRLYHLFSENEICNISRNSDGKCIDRSGNDVTRYVIESPNDSIFLKDDGDGNDGNNFNTENDIFHDRGEIVKVIFFDQYYYDNFGHYNLNIKRGIGASRVPGLIETLVSMIEDMLLGEINTETGQRSGGVIKSLYNSIVKDTGFASIVQVSLAIYVMVFGASVLAGVVEISRKELMSRIFKIGLIIFFVSPGSWYYYNEIVVKLFKDATDYAVSIISALMDGTISPGSAINEAYQGRGSGGYEVGNSVRFAFIDDVITRLFSDNITKKIWGLFFGTWFGFAYIIAIYCLIFYFIYVMIMAAAFYVTNMIKIIFVLAIGPIFFCFLLFNVTASMFKNWLSILVARSVEVVVLFMAIYAFIILIDIGFKDMLWIRVCTKSISLIPSLLYMDVLVTENDRSMADWVVQFISLGGLIFITNLIISQIGGFASKLAEMGSIAQASTKSGRSGGAESSGFVGGRNGMMSDLLSLASKGAKAGFSVAVTGGSYGVVAATIAARSSGAASAWNRVGKAIPFRGPRSRVRDSYIDRAISKASQAADKQGYTGPQRDQFIREQTFKNIAEMADSSPITKKYQDRSMRNKGNSMRLAGVDSESVAKRLDQKLVQEPLKGFIKQEAKKMRDKNPLMVGKEASAHLDKKTKEWMSKNLYQAGNDKYRDEQLKNLKSYIKDKSEMSSSEAAKRLAGDKDKQDKYLQHLKTSQFDRKENRDAAWKKGKISGMAHDIKLVAKTMMRDSRYNPKLVQQNFANKVSVRDDMTSKALPFAGKVAAIKSSALTKVLTRVNAARKGDKSRFDSIDKNMSDNATRNFLREMGKKSGLNEEELKRKDLFQKDLVKGVSLDARSKLSNLAKIQQDKKGVENYKGPKNRAQRLFDNARSMATPDQRRDKINKLNNKFEEERKDLFANLNKDPNESFYEKASRLRDLERDLGISSKEDYKDPLVKAQEILNSKSRSKIDEVNTKLKARQIKQEEAINEIKQLRSENVDLIYASSSDLGEKNDQLEDLMKKRIKDLEKALDSQDISNLATKAELMQHNQELDKQFEKSEKDGLEEIDKAIEVAKYQDNPSAPGSSEPDKDK